MRTYKHNTGRTFVAWLLLVLFMLPVVVKAVHVCNVHDTSEHSSTQAGNHDTGNCSICHFAFLSFDKAESIIFAVVAIAAATTAPFFFKAGYRFDPIALTTLRGPPHTL